MQKLLFAAVAFAGVVGAASGAFAAGPATVHHINRHPAQPAVQKVSVHPVQVMSEKPNSNPTLGDVFAASDGALYFPATNDPRSHGLPNF